MNANAQLSRRAEVVILAIIFVLALAPRVWCFIHNALPEGDAGRYLEVGRNLALGRGYTTNAKWFFYGELGPIVHSEGNLQPLVPLVTAATFALGAYGAVPARLLSLAAGLGALAVLYVLLRRWLGRGLALGGLALAALEPAFMWFSVRVHPEPYFTLLFFGALAVAGDFERERPSLLRPLFAGVLLGLSYLCRLDGALLLLAYVVALVVVYRGRGIAAAAISAGAFAAAALPWWIRNAATFGDPFYSQAKFFALAPTPEQVWAIKRYVPSWSGFFASYDFFELLGRYARGLWRALEPFFLGNLHLREPYAAAPLAAFAAFAVVALPLLRRRRALVFPALAFLAHLLFLAAYGGELFRYFVPFYLLLVPLGLAGAWRVAALFENRRRWAAAALVVVVVLPFARPVALTLKADDRQAFAEVDEVATWLAENTQRDDVVVTWPRVLQLLYQYDRPSLYWPLGGIREIQAILTQYDVRYVVLEPAVLAQRPSLKSIWYVGYKGLRKVPMDESEGELTIVRVDYGGDAFREVFRPEGSNVVVYSVDHDELRSGVYGAYLSGIQ
jgi:4-amino-4-deoxy-L-arabinose transferase-like glycosyltransferase